MNKIFKFGLFVFMTTAYCLVPSAYAYAQFPWSNIDPGNPPGFNPQFTDLGSVISALFPYVFWISGMLALLYVLWSGFRFMLSEGNPKDLEVARKQLFNALIGVLIVFASYWIVQIMEVIFNVTIL